MKHLRITLFALLLSCLGASAQKISFKDASGCAYEFKVVSKADREVALVSAANKKNPKLEVPGKVTYKGTEYTVTRVQTESLKDCDTELRVLTFPNTVKEIEGYLFGSAMKLMGGFGGALAGGRNERPMSTIKLESLRIPASVEDLGSGAFMTSLSTSGSKGLRAHIDELPKSVVPYTAKGYGLQESEVKEYWEKHDPEMLSPTVGMAATYEQMESAITSLSPRQKSGILKMLQSNNKYATQFIEPYEMAGFSREDIIALLKGEKNPTGTDVAAAVASTPTQPTKPSARSQTAANAVPPTSPAPSAELTSDVDKNIPETKTVNENTFVVIIANEKYQEEVPVEYANNDGLAFKLYCQKTLGIPEENIHIRQNATLNNMLAELDWISMVAKAFAGEARVMFYYAGHGIPDEATGVSYLLPVDGIGRNLRTGYSLAELYKQLGELPAKDVTVFMDACFSGAQRGNGMLASARGVAIKAKMQAPQGKMMVLSAAQGDETAYPYKDKQHGLFTYFLLKKLQETGGNCTMEELSEYVKTQVSRRSIIMNQKSQTPSIGISTQFGDDWKTIKLTK